MKDDNLVLTGGFNGYKFALSIIDVEAIGWTLDTGPIIPCTTGRALYDEDRQTVLLKITAHDLKVQWLEREQGTRDEKH